MLRFTEYTEIKNHIEGLLEANIHMPRYSEGDMVVLKDGKISVFFNLCISTLIILLMDSRVIQINRIYRTK